MIYICVCMKYTIKTTSEVMTRWSFCPILSISVISLHFCPSPCGANCTCIGRGWRSSVAFLAKSAAFFRRIHKIHQDHSRSFKIIQDHSRSTMQLKHIETSNKTNKTDTTNRRAAAVFGRATLAGHPRSLAWQPFDWATGDWISEILVTATAHGTPESGRNENIPDSFISIEIILVKIINLRWSQKHKVCLRLKPRTWQSLRL